MRLCSHLTLINFALADHLAIDIEQGFNVLTGETGAGKSLLLDALSACLGERTDKLCPLWFGQSGYYRCFTYQIIVLKQNGSKTTS